MLWNLSSGECEATLVGHEHGVTAIVQYSPTQLCSGSYDDTIRLWDISTGACEKVSAINAEITRLALLPNRELACYCYHGRLIFYNIETEESSGNVSKDARMMVHMIQLASGDVCTSYDKSEELTIWDYKTHKQIKTIHIGHFYANDAQVFNAAVLRDGRLAVCIYSKDDEYKFSVLIYNLETGECEQVLHDTRGHYMVQLSDGRLVCCAGDSDIVVWA
jgi:WD40 repeat protein